MLIAAEGAIDKEHSRTGLRAPGRETRRIPCLTKRWRGPIQGPLVLRNAMNFLAVFDLTGGRSIHIIRAPFGAGGRPANGLDAALQ